MLIQILGLTTGLCPKNVALQWICAQEQVTNILASNNKMLRRSSNLSSRIELLTAFIPTNCLMIPVTLFALNKNSF